MFWGWNHGIKCLINEFIHIMCLQYLLWFFSLVLNSRQQFILFFRSCSMCLVNVCIKWVKWWEFLNYAEKKFINISIKQLEARTSLFWTYFTLGLSFTVLFVLHQLFGQCKLSIPFIFTTVPMCPSHVYIFYRTFNAELNLVEHKICLNWMETL